MFQDYSIDQCSHFKNSYLLFNFFPSELGVTDAFTHKKMDKADYMGFLSYLRADALRIYPNSIESNNQHGYATEDGTLVTGSANGRILTSATPSLPMLTYWNLFDSLKYSTAIASQSPNLSKVHDLVSELLATVGVPLIEVKIFSNV